MLWDSVMPDTLDWRVEKRDIFHANGEIIKDKCGIYRGDTYLNIVGRNYTPLQNTECAEFLQGLDATVEKAGTFGRGCKVWWVLKLNGDCRIGNEQIQKYSIMINAHDGSLGFRWFVTPIRPWCSNMLNMILRSRLDIALSAKHTRNIKVRAAIHAGLMQKVNELYLSIEDEYNKLAAQPMGDMAAYIKAVLQTERKSVMDQVMDNYEHDPGYGTRWGALNAVTQYLEHQRPMRGQNREERRFANTLFGTSFNLKQRAYDLLSSN